ncbi:hypothetical protein HU200_058248 [Digitaria exilis]|uniref:Uncharacterized protein n=1 Tax=Digitaria exilis TaxID=1010633 RepID=A0A835AA44_9POAL|nr:hypothetical protein HU200_058248 [Digitaria exilis]
MERAECEAVSGRKSKLQHLVAEIKCEADLWIEAGAKHLGCLCGV